MDSILEERSALGKNAERNKSSISSADHLKINRKIDVTQALIDLLAGDIGDNIAALIAVFNAALAMRQAHNIDALIHSLCCARCYWASIDESIGELFSADAERLSAIQQAEAGKRC
jgi:hypothetical protein